MLRTLAVLLILGLNSTAGAAEGLFHLCRGRLQFDLTCCCSHAKVEQVPPDAQLSGEHPACCDELKVQLASTPSATAASRHAWLPLPVAVVPRMASVVPPAVETLPPEWVRIRGVHPSTAPPLYIQHCSYLR
jgi:hypothetical protein